MRAAHNSPSYLLAKRLLDICCALPGLIVLALVLPIIALLIWWEDRGPIFYQQERLGLHGQPFKAYKLRSMVRQADSYLAENEGLGCSWSQNGKLQADPRVTRIGRILRRTSLDELPQLLNILRGEMSLVGPRAVQARELVAFGDLAMVRQMVKPGLTGLWQVSGRADTTYTQRGILDCTYVMECSFAMDLMILWQTFPVVVNGTGAY